MGRKGPTLIALAAAIPWQDVAVIGAALAAVLAASAIGVVLHQFGRLSRQLLAQRQRTQDSPPPQLADAPPRILVPDYLDEEGLQLIAGQVGVSLRGTVFSETAASSTHANMSARIGARAIVPPVDASASATAQGGFAQSWEQTVSLIREASLSDFMETLYARLADAGHLRTDIAGIPKQALSDAHLPRLLMGAATAWDLDDALAPGLEMLFEDPGPRALRDWSPTRDLAEVAADTPDEAVLGEGEAINAGADDVRVAGAIWIVVDAAFARVRVAKQEHLAEIAAAADQVPFARVFTHWRAGRDDQGRLVLRNAWLVVEGQERNYNVLSPDLIEVPLDDQKITAMGRQRLVEGAQLWAEVFGKIERPATADAPLRVLPWGVFAA